MEASERQRQAGFINEQRSRGADKEEGEEQKIGMGIGVATSLSPSIWFKRRSKGPTTFTPRYNTQFRLSRRALLRFSKL